MEISRSQNENDDFGLTNQAEIIIFILVLWNFHCVALNGMAFIILIQIHNITQHLEDSIWADLITLIAGAADVVLKRYSSHSLTN